MTTPSHSSLPVAITMGDPSGVGAEVIVKALAQYDEETRKKIVIVGDRAILDRASKVCGVTVPFTIGIRLAMMARLRCAR